MSDVRLVNACDLYHKAFAVFKRACDAAGNEEVFKAVQEMGTEFEQLIQDAPTIDAAPVDAVEVVPGYHVGDVCFYGFGSQTNCLALVEIQKILDDERGVAEIKFLKVFTDTGNNFFDYLLRTGQTMNGSFEYLKNITPKRGE